ncbi:MAG TPA: cupin domain-containing protein [Thermoleophilaceae bacterium]|jgi:mannose-6-phosphate isomerase-like protein (cupin superfamily)
MADYTLKRIDDMEGIYGGAFKRARAELGVTSFGMQVLDMPPNIDAHPEHDHNDDGQEEVYFVLSGSADIEIEGERHRLEPGTMVRVGPDTKRKLYTGDESVRMVMLGGVPGKPYEIPDITKLGEPDPMAQPAQ